jgi:hypothetical protein
MESPLGTLHGLGPMSSTPWNRETWRGLKARHLGRVDMIELTHVAATIPPLEILTSAQD